MLLDTFPEQESYFKVSHLQGEGIRKEDEPLREDELLIFSRPEINPGVVNMDKPDISPTQPEIQIQLETETTVTKLNLRLNPTKFKHPI